MGYRALLLILIFFAAVTNAHAQTKFLVRGTVYDSSRTYVLESVTVQSTGGNIVTTDAKGVYNILVSSRDSIWFSYLGRPTQKFAAATISYPAGFDLALQVSMKYLPEVRIRPRDYKLDSIRNREEYAKIFNFRRPNVESMTSTGPTGAGIDVNELIRVFQFRKNKSQLRFKARLEQQEREKYVDFRFSKQLIRRLTGLEGDALQRFSLEARPTYEFALSASDYQFREYIKRAYAAWKR